MQLPVTLPLRTSRSLVAALVVAHALAAGGLLATNLGGWVKIALVLVLALSLALTWHRFVLRPCPVALTLKADGQIEAMMRDGTTTAFQVDTRSTVLSWLVVLRLRGGDGPFALTLPPDALPGDDHRLLRLWLRWKAPLS